MGDHILTEHRNFYNSKSMWQMLQQRYIQGKNNRVKKGFSVEEAIASEKQVCQAIEGKNVQASQSTFA